MKPRKCFCSLQTYCCQQKKLTPQTLPLCSRFRLRRRSLTELMPLPPQVRSRSRHPQKTIPPLPPARSHSQTQVLLTLNRRS